MLFRLDFVVFVFSLYLFLLVLKSLVFSPVFSHKCLDGIGLSGVINRVESDILFDFFSLIHDLNIDLLVSEFIALLDQPVDGFVSLIQLSLKLVDISILSIHRKLLFLIVKLS